MHNMESKYAHLNIIRRKLSELNPHKRNPRKHPDAQKYALAKSIEQFSYAKGSICIQKGTNQILAGHEIRTTLMKAGYIEADVIELDFDDAKSLAFMTADNQLGLLSEWDDTQLTANLAELKELEWKLEDLGFELEPVDGDREETFDIGAAIEEEAEPFSKLGDVWTLGRHRVMCGDSTLKEDVERLMAGKKADMVLTDPPYGINIVKGGKVGGGGEIKMGGVGKGGGGKYVDAKTYLVMENDTSTESARRFYEISRESGINQFIIWGGNYFADFLPPSSCWIVWDKQRGKETTFADGELAWTSFDTPVRIYTWLWDGLCRWGDRKSELVKRVAPTQKPVGLFVQLIQDYGEDAHLILDGFLGSGTTLIACEKTNRTCYGMEIVPHYVDIIIKRYTDYVGSNEEVRGERSGEEISWLK